MKQEWLHVLRSLGRRPGFVATFLLTMAMGLGANAAIFGLVNGILLKPLPFKEPERLVSLWSTGPDRARQPFSIPDFVDYHQRSQTFEAIGAMGSWGANLTGAGEAERLAGLWITPGLLPLLGAEVAIGRAPAPEEERAGGPRVVLLSHALWTRRYDAQAAILGSAILLNGEPYTIVGVLPRSFALPGRDIDLLTPFFLDSDNRRLARGADFMRPLGRLKPGVSLTQAQGDLTAVAVSLRQEHLDTNANKTGVSVTSMHEEVVGRFSVMLKTLQAAALLVLLLAGVNLGSLLLARLSQRAGELALRSALGASRAALVRMVLMEHVLLALLGGGLGVLVAAVLLRLVLAFGPQDLPRKQEIGVDGTMVFASVALALLTSLACGLIPALRATRAQLQGALRHGGREGQTPSASRARSVLVASEFALAFVLLSGALLLIQSLIRLQAVEPGWEAKGRLTLRLSLPRSRYGKTEALATFVDRLTPRLAQLHGVTDVAAASVLPLGDWRATVDLTVPGPEGADGMRPEAQYRMVSAGYFKAMGIARLRGREFAPGDGPLSGSVVVINDALARRFFQGVDPVGRFIKIDDAGPVPRAVEIVGVVGDVKHYGLDAPPTYDVYVPIPQIPETVAIWLANNMSFVVHASGEPPALAKEVRRELRALDGDIPASSVRTMDEALGAHLAPRRFGLFLLEGFAVFAVLLAMIGIYAVTAQSVSQRTRELGLRAALGAGREQLLALVVSQGLRPVSLGLGAGLVAAYLSARAAKAMLFGIAPGDPRTMAAVFGGLLLVALFAVLLPGRRALSVAPTIALRSE